MLKLTVFVVVLVYVGVCPSAARMYEPRPGATVVDVVLGTRLTAERFPLVTAEYVRTENSKTGPGRHLQASHLTRKAVNTTKATKVGYILA